MSDQIKKFTIEVEAGTQKAEEQIAALRRVFKELNAEVTGGFSKANDVSRTTRTSFSILTKEIASAKDLADRLKQSFAAIGTSYTMKGGFLHSLETEVRKVTEVYDNEARKREQADKELAKKRAADEKWLTREIEKEEKAKFNDRRRFYHEWINEAHALHQQEIAAEKQKNAEIRRDTVSMYRDMFDQIASQERSAQAARAARMVQNIPHQKYEAPKPISQGFANVAGLSQQKTPDLTKVAAQVDEVGRKHKNWAVRVIEIIGLYRAIDATLGLLKRGLLSIPQAGIQLEGVVATLTATFGSTAQAHKQLAFLNFEANRTGLSLGNLRESYKTFSASLLLAGESAETVNRIFTNVNTIATTLHMSFDDVQGTFLALSQAFNKGHLQAEEVVKQLAQRLPGIYNQAALALGLTTKEFGEQMKKGLVEAHGSVDKVMAQMAQSFGGEAFKRASVGLNSEVGRLSTAWTLAAQNIYSASSEIMVSVVRMLSGSVSNFATAIENTEQFKESFKAMMFEVVGAAAGFAVARTGVALYTTVLAAATAGTTGLTAATTGLMTLMKRNIFSLALVGLGLYVGKLLEAKALTADVLAASKEYDDYKNAQATPERQFQYSVDQDPDVKAAKAKFDDSVKLLSDSAGMAKDKYDKLYQASRNLHEQYLAIRKRTEAGLKQAPGETYKPGVPDASDAIARTEIERLKNSGDKIAAARAEFLQNNKEDLNKLMAAYAAGDEKAGAALQAFKANYENAGKDDKAGKKEHRAGVKAEYKDIATSLEAARAEIETQLIALDAAFQHNGITYQEYFVNKRKLQQDDLDLQRQILNEQLQLAFREKDVVKVADINKNIAQLDHTARRQSIQLINEESQALAGYRASLVSVQEQMLRFQGKDREAAIMAFNEQNKMLIQQSVLQEVAGNAEGSRTLDNLNILRSAAGVQAELNGSKERGQILSDQLANKELQIQTAQKLGAKTELQALYDVQQARQEYIAEMEKELSMREKLLGTPGMDPKTAQEIRNARAQLEAFRSEADLVSQKFRTIFAQNLTNGFTEFATGAANAQQAFNTFTRGVIGNIAEIVAQEASSGIIKLLMQGFGSMMGSFGQDTSFVPGSMDVTGPPLRSAKGNVVQFARGGIPDTGSDFATFRMANGGLGSLREKGPEFIMPAKRDSYGNLGVKADLSGIPMGGNSYNVTVIVQSNGKESPDQLGGKIAEATMRAIAKEEIATSRRAGNNTTKVA